MISSVAQNIVKDSSQTSDSSAVEEWHEYKMPINKVDQGSGDQEVFLKKHRRQDKKCFEIPTATGFIYLIWENSREPKEHLLKKFGDF